MHAHYRQTIEHAAERWPDDPQALIAVAHEGAALTTGLRFDRYGLTQLPGISGKVDLRGAHLKRLADERRLWRTATGEPTLTGRRSALIRDAHIYSALYPGRLPYWTQHIKVDVNKTALGVGVDYEPPAGSRPYTCILTLGRPLDTTSTLPVPDSAEWNRAARALHRRLHLSACTVFISDCATTHSLSMATVYTWTAGDLHAAANELVTALITRLETTEHGEYRPLALRHHLSGFQDDPDITESWPEDDELALERA